MAGVLLPASIGFTVSFLLYRQLETLGEELVSEADRGDVQIAVDLCKGCTLCIAACPAKVLVQSNILNRLGYYAVTYKGSGCTGCGICFYVCPEPAAITVRVRKKEEVVGA